MLPLGGAHHAKQLLPIQRCAFWRIHSIGNLSMQGKSKPSAPAGTCRTDTECRSPRQAGSVWPLSPGSRLPGDRGRHCPKQHRAPAQQPHRFVGPRPTVLNDISPPLKSGKPQKSWLPDLPLAGVVHSCRLSQCKLLQTSQLGLQQDWRRLPDRQTVICDVQALCASGDAWRGPELGMSDWPGVVCW